MADSLTKVGSIDRWTIDPDWSGDLSPDYKLSRRLMGYPGTSHVVEPIAPETPMALALTFACATKQREYELITQFVYFMGRLKRFWMKSPHAAFHLKTNAVSGAAGIYCYYNAFEPIFQGYERVYILMADGDLIVRKVTAVSDSVDNYTYLVFDTPIDRDILLTNYLRIGRYLLGRFDSDSLKFTFRSNVVNKAELNFLELVKEYYLAD
jgi:hypothetical protein